ncbi:MAG: Verru_Chthon cassette protein C [Verrucomicrobiales bacterium]|jgi:uncharacterized protein (TIGR02599 family)|nr:Verru_Chthon cassette protein C [Verrucomicrobiales bacterium]
MTQQGFSATVSGPRRWRAFTLVEVMASVAVLSLILVILMAVTVQLSNLWQRTSGQIEQFRGARMAFESLTRRLSQATLNTYWDYDNPTTPTRYVRQSELRFLMGSTAALTGGAASRPTHAVFFQAPLGLVDDTRADAAAADGLANLLNTCGYFIEFGDNEAERPRIFGLTIGAPRYRYRLYEFIQPANALTLYNFTGTTRDYTGRDWFDLDAADRPAHILADNVIALVLRPRLSAQDADGAPQFTDYGYDSTATNSDAALNPKNQLPPIVSVTLVAIDETTARRLENGGAAPDFGLDALFVNAGQQEEDLRALEDNLIASHANYRIFTANIAIHGAKWSREQGD